MPAGIGAHDGHRHLAVGLADAQALKSRAQAGDRQALGDVARQFEALMVTQMLKTLRETRFADEDDPFSGGDAGRLYRDLLDQQWARAVTEGRGLGLADMMLKALATDAASDGRAPVPGDGGRLPSAPARAPAVSTAEAAPPAGAAPAAPPTASGDGATEAAARKARFLAALRPHAERAEAVTGVPARFMLAQAALESGWGERQIRSADGRASHNLFGIKAGAGWEGARVEATTTEYRAGLPLRMTQSFRAYADYDEAFADYAALLRRRYGDAVAAGNDAAGFSRALARGGYATDPAYADKLRAVIASVERSLA
jgi:flagellar protein FlgJ